MKTARNLQWALILVALTIGGLPALADDAYLSRPLVQARFDRLIPTSYPTFRPKFTRLIPTTLPLIQPGIARIPITENLVYPLYQPLLIVNQSSDYWAAALSRRPRLRAHPRAVSVSW
jgi:hypothetical protein